MQSGVTGDGFGPVVGGCGDLVAEEVDGGVLVEEADALVAESDVPLAVERDAVVNVGPEVGTDVVPPLDVETDASVIGVADDVAEPGVELAVGLPDVEIDVGCSDVGCPDVGIDDGCPEVEGVGGLVYWEKGGLFTRARCCLIFAKSALLFFHKFLQIVIALLCCLSSAASLNTFTSIAVIVGRIASKIGMSCAPSIL